MSDYDEFSVYYDLLLGDWQNTVKTYTKLMTNLLLPEKNEYFIDVACGTGVYLAALGNLSRFTVGIDTSRQMLLKAKHNFRQLFIQPLLLLASWDKMPFDRDLNANIVCMGNSLAHCISDEQLLSVLREFKRVVGNGKILIDSRNTSQLIECDQFRERGHGLIDSVEYWLYDSFQIVNAETYIIEIRVCRNKDPFKSQVFKIPLKYRMNIIPAIVSAASKIGFRIDNMLSVNDFGELFDIIVLSKV